MSRVTAFTSTTKHLTVCTRRQTCQRSLIDIQMYACTSSKFDHLYQGEGIVGLSSKGLLAKMTDAHIQKHICAHCWDKHQSWKLQQRLIVLLKQTHAQKSAFGETLATPSSEFSSAVVRDPDFPQPVSDASRVGRGQREWACHKETSSWSTGREHCGSREREAVKTQQRDSTGACAAVPLRSIFNASNSTSAKGMHNYRFLNNS